LIVFKKFDMGRVPPVQFPRQQQHVADHSSSLSISRMRYGLTKENSILIKKF